MSSIQTNGAGIVHDEMEIVPYVGMTGRFNLKAPYTALVNADTEYTCTGVVSLSGAIAQGEDLWTEVYEANGATQEAYAQDALSNHCVVTLQSGMGEIVRVPNSALMALPDADGIRYVNVMLGVSLSALPDSVNLSALQTEISDLVFHRLGVRSTVYPAVFGAPAVVSHDRHAAIEAARQVNITSSLSTRTENEVLRAQVTAQVAHIAMLEAHVQAQLTQ